MSAAFSDWESLVAYLATLSKEHQEHWVSPTGHAAYRFAYSYRGEQYGVFVVHNDRAPNQSWVYIGVRAVPANSVDLEQIMPEVSRGAIGALSLARDYLCTSHNMPIHDLRADDLTVIIDTLCDLTAYCRAQVRSPDLTALDYLSE